MPGEESRPSHLQGQLLANFDVNHAGRQNAKTHCANADHLRPDDDISPLSPVKNMEIIDAITNPMQNDPNSTISRNPVLSRKALLKSAAGIIKD